VTDTPEPASTDESVPPDRHARPSIAERAARREQLYAGGRDRYGALLRSLQAGRELPLYRRGGRLSFDWHPVLWTLVKVAVVVGFAYLAVRAGAQWWRENHVDSWAGPSATVQSGVRLTDCAIVDIIRVDDFPSWVTFEGSVYRYTGLKRPYIGPETPGYTATEYSNGAMRLVLLENTPAGRSRDEIMIWLDGALAGIVYARTPECSPPQAARP
jgi:hypothetical protein